MYEGHHTVKASAPKAPPRRHPPARKRSAHVKAVPAARAPIKKKADPAPPKAAKPRVKKLRVFPPLEEVTKPILTTAEAAHYLNRAEQTLREWSAHQMGPLEPVHVFKKLGWKTRLVKALVGVAQ